MSVWNIFLDFDLTIAGGHSGGHRFSAVSPMDMTNQRLFLAQLRQWMEQGHNIAIVTRGIDEKIRQYFERILEVIPIMNDFEQGKLSIYAPDLETFGSQVHTDWWANKKIEFVFDIMGKIGGDSEGENSIFMDDTPVNVEAMKRRFPKMVCEHADPGNYVATFATVNSVIGSLPLPEEKGHVCAST